MAIYYVRPDGNNSNDGLAPTPDRAWQTLTKAANTVTAGDTVIIAPGTYTETLSPVNAGTVKAFIRWLGDESGEVFGVSPGSVTIQAPTDSDCIYLVKPYHEFGFLTLKPQAGGAGFRNAMDASGDVVIHDIKAVEYLGSTSFYGHLFIPGGTTGTYNKYLVKRVYATVPLRFVTSARNVIISQALSIGAVGQYESNGVWVSAYSDADNQSTIHIHDSAFVNYQNRSCFFSTGCTIYAERILFANSAYAPICGYRLSYPVTIENYKSCVFADISATDLATCSYTSYPGMLSLYDCAIISSPTSTSGWSAVLSNRLESLSDLQDYDLRFPNLYFLERVNPITGKANIRIPVVKWGRFFMEIPVRRGDRQLTLKIKKSWTGSSVKVLVNRETEQTLADNTDLQTLTFNFTVPMDMYVPLEVWAKASDYTERSVYITEIAVA
ncbi:hypothetical protein [Atrimonas thermophila]|uniref:hypothetical protein n=1 Tax=Atrimonas thermophila TaxID=3064161 RepID=UPI00399D18F3